MDLVEGGNASWRRLICVLCHTSSSFTLTCKAKWWCTPQRVVEGLLAVNRRIRAGTSSYLHILAGGIIILREPETVRRYSAAGDVGVSCVL
jgi:hypothetical protein